MRTITITLLAFFCFSISVFAQNAQKDLDITGKYRINTIIKGKYWLSATISNNSKSDYKDVVYNVNYAAEDGTIIDSAKLTFHDYVGPHTSKKIKEQYLDCPKDCKSVILSIVSGNKLD